MSTPLAPGVFRPVDVRRSAAPQLCVIVDTEEEFDWSAPLSRSSVGVSAIAEVPRLQDVLKPYNVRPTYVIDYPVASTVSSAERLAAIAHGGDCEIGAHLHPWVNPPYLEAVSPRTSYACNLEPDLEFQKIAALKAAVVKGLDLVPKVYKAGRYGFGRSSAAALERLDFDVDVSVNPHMNFSHDGGPSFEGFEAAPSMFGDRRALLELPCTTGFVGLARSRGESLHRAASSPWLAKFRAVGVLARTGLLNRIMLSPEGSTLAEMKALTTSLQGAGIRIFSLTLHSPSLKPQCTPYVRTTAEREAFLKTIGEYCRFFMGDLGGVPSTPAAVFAQLSKGHLI